MNKNLSPFPVNLRNKRIYQRAKDFCPPKVNADQILPWSFITGNNMTDHVAGIHIINRHAKQFGGPKNIPFTGRGYFSHRTIKAPSRPCFYRFRRIQFFHF
ncbi:hypothetical protein ABH19_08180 [Leptospirillum sp. Group II 'CF-1']|nr:hypothetical protein ABH19_08180 [Leptospirillum sp. Group II 'CF-1']